jgi:hypothetical protein
MTPHPYAALFPEMSAPELRSLADDIKEHGQHDPIITLSGEILDGRNRYRACEIAGVEPHLQAYQGDDPLAFVIGQNLHRRHLTESQRAMVAAKLANLKNGEKSKGGPIGPHSTPTRAQAAALLRVGRGSVGRAKLVQTHGDPELVKAVESGDVKVSTAATITELPKGEQRAVIELGPDAVHQRAMELRANGAKRPEVPRFKSNRLPPYQPTDSPEVWQQARLILDRILPADKHRERILKEVIAYCQNRITNKL